MKSYKLAIYSTLKNFKIPASVDELLAKYKNIEQETQEIIRNFSALASGQDILEFLKSPNSIKTIHDAYINISSALNEMCSEKVTFISQINAVKQQLLTQLNTLKN